MARINKTTDGVFVKMFGASADEVPGFISFLETNNPEAPSSTLRKFIKIYKDEVTAERLRLERLALVEEVVMQMRSKENITDIKPAFVRDYIYARAPIFRKDKPSKDVRVLVDHKKNWKRCSIKKLSSDETFLEMAKEKLSAQMDAVIADTLERLANIEARIESKTDKVIQKKTKVVVDEFVKTGKIVVVEKEPKAPAKKKPAAKPKQSTKEPKVSAKPSKSVKVAVIAEETSEQDSVQENVETL